jgi:hypothetical protein
MSRRCMWYVTSGTRAYLVETGAHFGIDLRFCQYARCRCPVHRHGAMARVHTREDFLSTKIEGLVMTSTTVKGHL